MNRYVVVALTIIVVSHARMSHAQDGKNSDGLIDRIAILEAELRLAEKENEALRSENDKLKSTTKDKNERAKKSLSDALPPDSVLKGDFRYVAMNGEEHAGEFNITVLERDGKKVKAEYKGVNLKNNFVLKCEIEGDIKNNRVVLRAVNTAKKFTLAGMMKGDSLEMDFVDNLGGKALMVAKLPK
jgi:hypothetical protein